MPGYTEIDKQIHQLSQIIAKVNRTYVPKEEDDSHTNLYYDPISERIFGRWINTGDRQFIFTLNLKRLAFEWLDLGTRVLFRYFIEGQKDQEIEVAIEKELPLLGLKPKGFREPLHFEITEYPFKNTPYSKWDIKGLSQWKSYRSIANEACALLLGHLQHKGEIRIWPHHFDTGIYLETPQQLGLSFGWAMADAMIDEPYFYYSLYPLSDAINIDYNDCPSLERGRWLVGNWNGAVLPKSELKNGLHDTHAFLREVSRYYLKKNEYKEEPPKGINA